MQSRVRPWVIWCLIAYLVVVAVVVFTPVSYSGVIQRIAMWIRTDLGITFFGSGWIEFAGNVLLFVPFGFLLTLLFRHPWRGVVLAVLVSAGVELVQIVIPDRNASLRDVISNTLGAAVGAALAWLIVLRRGRRSRRGPQDD